MCIFLFYPVYFIFLLDSFSLVLFLFLVLKALNTSYNKNFMKYSASHLNQLTKILRITIFCLTLLLLFSLSFETDGYISFT